MQRWTTTTNGSAKIGVTGHTTRIVESRREQQVRLLEGLSLREVFRNTQIRNMHEMGEMKRAQEQRIDEVSVQKLRFPVFTMWQNVHYIDLPLVCWLSSLSTDRRSSVAQYTVWLLYAHTSLGSNWPFVFNRVSIETSVIMTSHMVADTSVDFLQAHFPIAANARTNEFCKWFWRFSRCGIEL